MSYTRVFFSTLFLLSITTVSLADSEPNDIHDAARLGRVAEVSAGLQADPSLLNARTVDGESLLHSAVLGRNAALVAELLKAGADVDAVTHNSRAALHFAASTNSEAIVDLLVHAGASVNAQDDNGDTPLHVAARACRELAISSLLEGGADPTIANNAGYTALHVLGASARIDGDGLEARLANLGRRLIEHGADAAIIADGFPRAVESTPIESKPHGYRDTWTDYDDIGPTLLAYQSTYPTLVRRYSLGKSVQNRDLWAIKISDNVDVEEDEPEFKYIATMHGDEIVGTKMCMNLIDYLLANYGTDTEATNIVDNIEVWIVPLMNPDGYDRTSRTRYNANGYDLNRNFPDGYYGEPNTPAGHPIEVQHIMNFGFAHSFVCSANFHGGALVANYPFDNDGNGSSFSPTPDEDLFVEICEIYSYLNTPMWNSSSFTHGITNGADWYTIDGGMQDWNYRYMGCNDVTMEIGDTKQPSASTIPTYWSQNRDSMLAYMQTCLIGVRGIVTNGNTGDPLSATITVVGRDHNVYTDPDVGDYHRMLLPGSYQIRIEADGFETQTHSVVVNSGDATRLDVAMYGGAIVTTPNGGDALPVGVSTNIEWNGSPTAQFHVQYTGNYGESQQILDGFERIPLGDDYTTGGNANWATSQSSKHSGVRAAKAGTLANSQSCYMSRTAGQGGVGFWYRVSSEAGYDFFNFYVDGSLEHQDSGDSGWVYYSTTLGAGDHTLKWEYKKDSGSTGYLDTLWVDDIDIQADVTQWVDLANPTTSGTTSLAWTPPALGTDYKVRVRTFLGGGAYGVWDESDATFSVVDAPDPVGDLNCDGALDSVDIEHFVQAVIDEVAYNNDHDGDPYDTCDRMRADMNDDGYVNGIDIADFVQAILGQ